MKRIIIIITLIFTLISLVMLTGCSDNKMEDKSGYYTYIPVRIKGATTLIPIWNSY